MGQLGKQAANQPFDVAAARPPAVTRNCVLCARRYVATRTVRVDPRCLHCAALMYDNADPYIELGGWGD